MQSIPQMAEVFKLLGDKSRLSILALLKEKSLCVCEIVEIMGLSQPNVSQHMRKLKDGGLVTETRKGQWIYYSLSIEDKPYLQEVFRHLPSQKEKVDALNCSDDCCV
ncbi:ArsR/SmtB family transcription factor [Paenibacillus mucilaginosus]|uniref:ArsR family transcriptional regulator n=2 Tax=Paenibacillus mucilaginosus TaxID=61624 RepID=H6N9P9_9BACL|nr:metalloregulator ArsR/SmtB family transcription factor [Paenibacillus mucilaginosus]AEI41945.1 transcriptional regulator, ArsR family [Paenibacillus mucilaginosus KNP414]AFC28206.1 ArsR family transcriptional regulator [Paenibacillus mucilaginosus 3016]MCG7218094.1 metalloregulator ArsR/SmtB family transcription factor [Paenibacillus mucilaginosus]WDM28852.1 winged helix-turn-helix transcriptional regulator [Paenibacillus mucilaginosus]WFA17029.1 ArsR family transcriptional regulator [Paeni